MTARCAGVALGLAIVAATGTAVAAAALTSPVRVTLDGVGRVSPGMSAATASARWGVPLALDYSGTGSICGAALLRRRGIDGYAVFIRGRFGAVFFRRGAITPRGIRIGSTLAQLRAAYGSLLRSRPNEYTPRARDYFVRRARRPRWELRFDVGPRGRVTQIAFGDESVRLVEGCA